MYKDISFPLLKSTGTHASRPGEIVLRPDEIPLPTQTPNGHIDSGKVQPKDIPLPTSASPERLVGRCTGLIQPKDIPLPAERPERPVGQRTGMIQPKDIPLPTSERLKRRVRQHTRKIRPKDIPLPLPPEWEARVSRTTKMTYYLNLNTKKSQWKRPYPPAEPTTIRCSHILVKHIHSRRPNSWRHEEITISKKEALETIRAYHTAIATHMVGFTDVAAIYSDCSSAKHDGDLGTLRRGQTQKEFEAEAFKLNIGQLSKPIESSSGFHIILRTV